MEQIEHYFKAAMRFFQIPSNDMILSAASRAARLGFCQLKEKQAEVVEVISGMTCL